MIEPTPFSLWLRHRRRLLDWTQADLAQAIGYSLSAVRKLESGDLLPSAEMSEKLADQLHVAAHQRAEFALFAKGLPNHFSDTSEPGASAPLPPATEPGALATIPPTTEPGAGRSLTLPTQSSVVNLPAPFTSLVGRDKEVAEIIARLRLPATRLLTLTGPPGSGKTRLSIAAAHALCPDFADGVHFASLAPITDPALVFSTLAHTLGIVENSRGPRQVAEFPQLDALAEFLQTRQFLLVLDNFEHLLAAAPGLSALLQAAAGLKILTTSREVLHLYGEYELPILPLPLPGTQSNISYTELSRSPAVQLFVERAQALQPHFVLTPENAPTVARICVRLDGLPLALEMAAAQMKWQSLDTIAGQLADLRLDLERTWRDANTRQQTLRAAIEWSYRLLPPAEQRLFNRLGVFAGGCTGEAVAAVQTALEKPDSSAPTLSSTEPEAFATRLHSLVERSLVQISFDETGNARYTLLETIREYALEQLAARGELDAVRRQLAHWFLAFAQQADAQLYSAQAKSWLQRLETEHDNFRAILYDFVERQVVDSETGLQLVVALSRFWNQVGHWDEGQRWMETGLARGVDASVLTRARVLRHLTSALGNRGQRAAALEVGKKSLALLRTVDHPIALADALYIMGYIYVSLHQFDHSQACLEEALTLLEGRSDQRAIKQNVLNALGNLMNARGNVSQSTDYGTQLLELARQAGDHNAMGNARNMLGEAARLQGKYADAARHYEESLRHAQESGSLSARAYRLPNLAFAVLHMGQAQRAHLLFAEGLALSHAFGDRIVILQCLVGLGTVVLGFGDATLAARLCGAVQQLLTTLELRFDQTDQFEYEWLLAALQSHLAADPVAAAWAAGQGMTLDAAVALARAEQGASATTTEMPGPA